MILLLTAALAAPTITVAGSARQSVATTATGGTVRYPLTLLDLPTDTALSVSLAWAGPGAPRFVDPMVTAGAVVVEVPVPAPGVFPMWLDVTGRWKDDQAEDQVQTWRLVVEAETAKPVVTVEPTTLRIPMRIPVTGDPEGGEAPLAVRQTSGHLPNGVHLAMFGALASDAGPAMGSVAASPIAVFDAGPVGMPVYVTGDLPPGLWKGTAHVTPEGGEPVTVPVEVDVRRTLASLVLAVTVGFLAGITLRYGIPFARGRTQRDRIRAQVREELEGYRRQPDPIFKRALAGLPSWTSGGRWSEFTERPADVRERATRTRAALKEGLDDLRARQAEARKRLEDLGACTPGARSLPPEVLEHCEDVVSARDAGMAFLRDGNADAALTEAKKGELARDRAMVDVGEWRTRVGERTRALPVFDLPGAQALTARRQLAEALCAAGFADPAPGPRLDALHVARTQLGALARSTRSLCVKLRGGHAEWKDDELPKAELTDLASIEGFADATEAWLDRVNRDPVAATLVAELNRPGAGRLGDQDVLRGAGVAEKAVATSPAVALVAGVPASPSVPDPRQEIDWDQVSLGDLFRDYLLPAMVAYVPVLLGALATYESKYVGTSTELLALFTLGLSADLAASRLVSGGAGPKPAPTETVAPAGATGKPAPAAPPTKPPASTGGGTADSPDGQ